MTTYSLFIERPRAGADPVPYGPFLKTKSLIDAEAWVAAPVLSAKAASNVREGDLFTARYPDPKLRDEHGPISRVVAFGKVTAAGIVVCTDRGVDGKRMGLQSLFYAGLTRTLQDEFRWGRNWLTSSSSARLLEMAAFAGVPRQLIVAAACPAVSDVASTLRGGAAFVALVKRWSRGKAPVNAVRDARQAYHNVYENTPTIARTAMAMHSVHAALDDLWSAVTYNPPLHGAVNAVDAALEAGGHGTASATDGGYANGVRSVIGLADVCFAEVVHG